MARPHYLPPKDQDRITWLNNFSTKLPGYKTTFNLTDADLAGVEADAAMWAWLVPWCEVMRARVQNLTAYKSQLRDGPGGPATAPPGAPTFDEPPATVPYDMFGRLGMLVQRIKNHPAYTDAIGQDLRIIAAGTTEDPATAKPSLALALVDGGRVNVGWIKRGMDGIRIEVDRGPGWQFLTIDTVPDYVDTAPLPPAGQSAVWKYRGIYVLGDQPAGQWSDPVSIAVMGA